MRPWVLFSVLLVPIPGSLLEARRVPAAADVRYRKGGDSEVPGQTSRQSLPETLTREPLIFRPGLFDDRGGDGRKKVEFAIGKKLLGDDRLLGFQGDVAIYLAIDSRNQLHQRSRESLAPFQSEQGGSPSGS